MLVSGLILGEIYIYQKTQGAGGIIITLITYNLVPSKN